MLSIGTLSSSYSREPVDSSNVKQGRQRRSMQVITIVCEVPTCSAKRVTQVWKQGLQPGAPFAMAFEVTAL